MNKLYLVALMQVFMCGSAQAAVAPQTMSSAVRGAVTSILPTVEEAAVCGAIVGVGVTGYGFLKLVAHESGLHELWTLLNTRMGGGDPSKGRRRSIQYMAAGALLTCVSLGVLRNQGPIKIELRIG